MSDPLSDAAADYLNLGLSVIALTGKTPNVRIHKRGLHEPIVGAVDTPEDWALIYRVFRHPDTTGVGIVIPYPYVVVDIDGPEGAEQWAELIGGDGIHPNVTWAAQTGRGLHLWFSNITPTGSIKLGSKLDLKGQSSYVAAPPSRHPDGHVYRWLREPGEPVLECPRQLEELIEEHNAELKLRIHGKERRRNMWGPKYIEGATKFYAQASHDALFEGMATALDGNRNNYLHWAAATLVEEGGSDDEFEMLGEAALARGLEPDEVQRTIRSARRLG